MSDQLLHKITKIAEDHAKTLDAKGQVKAISSCLFPCKSVMYFEFVFFQIIELVSFIRNFLENNPLCVCFDEISAVKEMMREHDELRLKQKASQVCVTFKELNYFVSLRIEVPDEYPRVASKCESHFI